LRRWASTFSKKRTPSGDGGLGLVDGGAIFCVGLFAGIFGAEYEGACKVSSLCGKLLIELIGGLL